MKLWTAFSIFFKLVATVRAHGYLIDPPQRSSLWREFPNMGFLPNYNDNELFCGGFTEQWELNGGKCGTCGDPFNGPRENEAGGKYAVGFIARIYEMGQTIKVQVRLTANHLGYFEFKLCPHNNIKIPVSQECLDKYPLEVVGSNGETKYDPGTKTGSHFIELILPYGVTCDQCVLQWRYTAGNNWQGPQETFVNCADIAIKTSGSGSIRPPTTGSKTVPTTSTTLDSTSKPKFPTSWPKTLISVPVTTQKPKNSTSTNSHVISCENGYILDCDAVNIEELGNLKEWCNSHCRKGSHDCTADFCICQCKRKFTCVGVGPFADIPGMDDWCDDRCQDGCADLENICECSLF